MSTYCDYLLKCKYCKKKEQALIMLALDVFDMYVGKFYCAGFLSERRKAIESTAVTTMEMISDIGAA